MNEKPPGWRNEPSRHALASRGIKTADSVSRKGMRMVARGEKYQGWANYNTWLAALDLSNNEDYIMENVEGIMESYINENKRFNSMNIIFNVSEWVDDYLRNMIETDARDMTYEISKGLLESALEDINTMELAKDMLEKSDKYNEYVEREKQSNAGRE